MVNADDLAGGGGDLETAMIFEAFGALGFTVSLAVGATWTGRWIDVGQVGGYKAGAGQETKDRKTEMAELFVQDGKAMLFPTDEGDSRIECGWGDSWVDGEVDGGRGGGRWGKIVIVEWDDVGLPR